MDEFAKAGSILEFHDSRYFGKQRVILANPHVQARFELSPALPNNDSAAIYQLSGKAFDSKSLGLAVSSIPGASDSFFVRHTDLLTCYIDFFDADFRMPLTMSKGASILFFLFVFEYKNRIVFILRFQLAQYRGAFH